VKSLEASQDAWNGYRNRHCTLEAEALGKGDRDRSRRAFSRCTLRVVKARLAERIAELKQKNEIKMFKANGEAKFIELGFETDTKGRD